MVSEQIQSLLHELQGVLQERSTPDWQAYASLQANRYGWPQEPYTDNAFRLWTKLGRQFPNRVQTMHHLAIMHHARAFDLERAQDPSQADGDWQRALELWHALCASEAFWKGLTRYGEPIAPALLRQAQETWPEQILQVHLDIAFHPTTKYYRARQHIRFMLDSPFAEEVKNRVRRRAYEKCIAHLTPAVWESTTFDPETLTPALKAITAFLDLDDEFLPALTDLLDLLTKYLVSYIQQFNAVSEETKGNVHLHQVRAFTQQYNPYVARLDREIERYETVVLAKLFFWHSQVGNAFWLLKDFEAAAYRFEQARRVARQDQDEARQAEVQRKWLIVLLLAARHLVIRPEMESVNKARQLLHKIPAQMPLPPECLVRRADIFWLLDELDAAKQDCQAALAALATPQPHMAVDPTQTTEALTKECQILLGLIQVKTEMSEQRWDVAIKQLDQLAQLAPDNWSIALLHRQCRQQQAEYERMRAQWQETFVKLHTSGKP